MERKIHFSQNEYFLSVKKICFHFDQIDTHFEKMQFFPQNFKEKKSSKICHDFCQCELIVIRTLLRWHYSTG